MNEFTEKQIRMMERLCDGCKEGRYRKEVLPDMVVASHRKLNREAVKEYIERELFLSCL